MELSCYRSSTRSELLTWRPGGPRGIATRAL
ncbi:rCG57217 [Rattus norvegicus]|uniref:RCG57217 n=1 Tax=Rattus norvegicus TaxID=10116 RepID=A6KPD3_RAT|nr:rCG57217 [Rattus norvegicus]